MTEPTSRAPSPAPGQPPSRQLRGRIGPDDAEELCACVCARVEAGESDPLGYDVDAVETPDIGTVDALARMALTARRAGRHVELRRARTDLHELLELAGLSSLERSGVEVGRQSEEREEPGGVEKEDDPADPIA